MAGLTACRDARLAAVVMAVPGVRSNRARAERVIWRNIRAALLEQRVAWDALDLTPLNLTISQPVIPKENNLLIEAVHDLLAPREAIEALWTKWGQPDIWRVPHGHFSFSLISAPGLMAGHVLRWLAPRLKARDAGAAWVTPFLKA